MTEGSGDTPTSDLSSLCQPIILGTEGTAQLVRSVQSGTSEIRHLLLHECDIVYECKVCRSLFRALPNFIAHKRVYCTEPHTSSRLHFIDDKPEDETIIVQPTAPAEGSTQAVGIKNDWEKATRDVALSDQTKRQQTAPSDGAVSAVTTSNSLTAQSRYTAFPPTSAMLHRGGSTMKPYEFYTQAARRVSRKRLKKRTNVLRLRTVTNSNIAVYQRNMYDVDADSFMQVHNRDDSDKSVVTVLPEDATGHIHMNLRKRALCTEVVPVSEVPDEKVSSKTITDNSMTATPKVSQITAGDGFKAHNVAIRTRMSLRKRHPRKALAPTARKLSLYSGCDVDELKCLKCNVKYSSMRTLRYHMSNVHAEVRHFFPCVYCDHTFSQMWGTTRHLRLIHHKSRAQVEKLRAKLKKLAYSKSIEELGREMNVDKTQPVTMTGHETMLSHECGSKQCKVMTSPVQAESRQPCSVAHKDSGQPSQITFSSAFSLHVCAACKQVFGRKNLLDNHMSTCNLNLSLQKTVVTPTKKGRPVSTSLLKQTSTAATVVNVSRSLTTTAVNDDPLVGISESDLTRICAMVDDTKLVCLKCHRHYGTISNLHRHAVRHLGWRRFKCKLCRYTAYNRSECTSHLHRVHTSNVVTHTKAEIENLILDLEPEKMKRERPALSRVDLRTIRGSSAFPMQSISPPMTKTSYNISTRRHARVFNTKPYGWPKHNSAVLCTRSGVYRKPVFRIGSSRSDSSSTADDSDRKDDVISPEQESSMPSVKKESGDEETAGTVCASTVDSSLDIVHCQGGSNNCARQTQECTDSAHMATVYTTRAGDPCTAQNKCCEKKGKASTSETSICAVAHVNCALNDKVRVSSNGNDAAEAKECAVKTKRCATEKNDHESKNGTTSNEDCVDM